MDFTSSSSSFHPPLCQVQNLRRGMKFPFFAVNLFPLHQLCLYIILTKSKGIWKDYEGQRGERKEKGKNILGPVH